MNGQGPVGTSVHGVVQPLSGARFSAGFHEDISSRNRRATIPHGIRMLEKAGNLRNFRRLTGDHEGPFEGPRFADSDVYKMLEAVAWELGRADEPVLRNFFDDTVSLLESAQREDGYLDSAFQLGEPFGQPWSDFVHGHELYCLGHLIQAAVASVRAAGDVRLLRIAERFVAHVFERFGGDDSPEYCGHPEVETALIELHRLTGDLRALRLAEAFLRRRGTGFLGDGVFGSQYYQDDERVVDTTTMRGHAVRALYLNAGVADIYLERGDAELLRALESQWKDLVARRMYITGGTGSRHRDEAFGDAYELPSERAYAETCAGIALVHWAWRMYLATGGAAYLDVLERSLYNVVLAGVSDDGTRFFYSNPLQLRSDHGASQQESAGERLDWYWCACCPPNLMRVFATLEHMIFAQRGEEIQIANLASAALPLADGGALSISSAYPAEGSVSLQVDGDAGGRRIALRVPGWSRGPRVVKDGEIVDVKAVDGWLHLGVLTAGTTIDVTFDMDVVAWHPHPGIDALRGTVAYTRGPLVYCADQGDNELEIEAALVAPDAVARVGRTVTGSPGPLIEIEVERHMVPFDAMPLYRRGWAYADVELAATPLRLRPYATWGNSKSLHAMKVWLPQASGAL